MKKKLTKTIWVTKTGERIPVKNMTDSHLVNTIRLIRRRIRAWRFNLLLSMESGLSSLQGEMAQDCLEGEIRQLENSSDIELAEDVFHCEIFETMLHELEKRGLNEPELDDKDS